MRVLWCTATYRFYLRGRAHVVHGVTRAGSSRSPDVGNTSCEAGGSSSSSFWLAAANDVTAPSWGRGFTFIGYDVIQGVIERGVSNPVGSTRVLRRPWARLGFNRPTVSNYADHNYPWRVALRYSEWRANTISFTNWYKPQGTHIVLGKVGHSL